VLLQSDDAKVISFPGHGLIRITGSLTNFTDSGREEMESRREALILTGTGKPIWKRY
jgi:hypothetical protein